METKPTARELLKEAWEILADAKSDGKDGLSEGTLSVIGKVMGKIDAYLAAPSESAMKVVWKIRDTERDFFTLSNTEAAALIEGLQRRVPDNYLREEKELLAAKDEYIALLEKASGEGAMFAYIHGSHVPQADIDAGIRCRAKIAELSAKHSVVIE